jgi:hypothetical protein
VSSVITKKSPRRAVKDRIVMEVLECGHVLFSDRSSATASRRPCPHCPIEDNGIGEATTRHRSAAARARTILSRLAENETYQSVGSEIGVSRQRIEQIVRWAQANLTSQTQSQNESPATSEAQQ